jgi:hypothetical protein
MAAAGDPLLLSFYGTAVGNNKSLRKELINMRSKRDEFLVGRLNLLEPFLLPKVWGGVRMALIFVIHFIESSSTMIS